MHDVHVLELFSFQYATLPTKLGTVGVMHTEVALEEAVY